jgi:hypothetical protein
MTASPPAIMIAALRAMRRRRPANRRVLSARTPSIAVAILNQKGEHLFHTGGLAEFGENEHA